MPNVSADVERMLRVNCPIELDANSIHSRAVQPDQKPPRAALHQAGKNGAFPDAANDNPIEAPLEPFPDEWWASP